MGTTILIRQHETVEREYSLAWGEKEYQDYLKELREKSEANFNGVSEYWKTIYNALSKYSWEEVAAIINNEKEDVSFEVRLGHDIFVYGVGETVLDTMREECWQQEPDFEDTIDSDFYEEIVSD